MYRKTRQSIHEIVSIWNTWKQVLHGNLRKIMTAEAETFFVFWMRIPEMAFQFRLTHLQGSCHNDKKSKMKIL